MKRAEIHTSFVVLDGKPIDKRMVIWQSLSWILANIDSTKRYVGLTVPAKLSGHTIEYWWKEDITNAGLVPKVSTSIMTSEERDLLVAPYEGYEIYNLTTHTKEFYNGTIWKTIATV